MPRKKRAVGDNSPNSAAEAMRGVKRILNALHDPFDDIQGITGNFPGSEYTDDEREFIVAMGRYMDINRRKFPQFSEVLAVAHSLGWRRIAAPTALPTYPIKREQRSASLRVVSDDDAPAPGSGDAHDGRL